jgi:hypothetical protein
MRDSDFERMNLACQALRGALAAVAKRRLA